MCVGGFPDAVRRQAKRGRPKKSRPGIEERVQKSSRTRRRALASAASSSSGGSPPSDFSSPRHQSPLPYSMAHGLNRASANDNFGRPLSSSSDAFK
jgi:regulatory protein SWI5